ncbi:hypothetical protein [Psychrobacter lutiphocae]|uniref:hypothetical protein n=1 Tax=Psychrobacter lutiphocae TaxID=540500 RepID=UPI00036C28C4|nr:hypothetical protein [Psychrobacter lutiphocae]
MTSLSLLLGSDQSHITLQSFTDKSAKSLIPLPASLIFPFENYCFIDANWLSAKLSQARQNRATNAFNHDNKPHTDDSYNERGLNNKALKSSNLNNVDLNDDECNDDDFYDDIYEIGLLDK